MQIAGRTALVTGGARGIGREITRLLVEMGAHVIVVGRNGRQIDTVVAEHGQAVSGMKADLADPEDVDRLIAEIAALHPDLAILVNNAALQTEMDFVGTDGWTGDIRQEISVNLDAAISLCAGLLPLMKRQPEAAIVNVTTALAIAPKRSAPVYCATKAGLRSFTRALRYQCRKDAPHIHISEAVMALVDTDMTRGRGSGKISADKAAADIMDAIANNTAEAWVAKTKLLRVINRISPETAARILR